MTQPTRLFTPPALPRLADTALIVIDAQEAYRTGLPLTGIEAALTELADLLARARAVGTPIVHIVHLGKPGSLFDPAGGGAVLAAAAPHPGEAVIEKTLPNSFAATGLADHLATLGDRPLLLAGFMTHMCVDSTARAALDRGHQTIIASDAVATRDLLGVDGSVVPAADVHRASLAALADRFALVVPQRSLT